VEAQITTIGTILLAAFYAIGYLLNRQAKKNGQLHQTDKLDSNSSEFLSSLSSTASQSTSLNMLLWERVTSLEVLQDNNQKQIELLKLSNQQKDQRIADLEQQIQQLLHPSNLQESQ